MTNVVAIRQDMEPAAPEVPADMTFLEISALLLRAAQQEAFSLDALHLFALRDPTSVGLTTIGDVQRQCAAYFDMSRLLRALAPHEDFIRAIASRSETRA